LQPEREDEWPERDNFNGASIESSDPDRGNPSPPLLSTISLLLLNPIQLGNAD